jgi:hypothetical protein
MQSLSNQVYRKTATPVPGLSLILSVHKPKAVAFESNLQNTQYKTTEQTNTDYKQRHNHVNQPAAPRLALSRVRTVRPTNPATTYGRALQQQTSAAEQWEAQLLGRRHLV